MENVCYALVNILLITFILKRSKEDTYPRRDPFRQQLPPVQDFKSSPWSHRSASKKSAKQLYLNQSRYIAGQSTNLPLQNTNISLAHDGVYLSNHILQVSNNFVISNHAFILDTVITYQLENKHYYCKLMDIIN